MRVLVTGHRSYGDRLGFFQKLDELHRSCGISSVIVGYVYGPCKFAKEWCQQNGVALKQMVNDHTIDSRGNVRRQHAQIIGEMRPDLVITVGDLYAVEDIERRARAAGIDIMEIRVR